MLPLDLRQRFPDLFCFVPPETDKQKSGNRRRKDMETVHLQSLVVLCGLISDQLHICQMYKIILSRFKIKSNIQR
jgi:hypothetical protein